MRRFLGAFLVFASLAGLLAPGAPVEAAPRTERFLVGVADDSGQDAVRKAGGRVLQRYEKLGTVLVELPADQADAIRKDSRVKYVERDEKIQGWETDHLTWQTDHLTWQTDHLTWQTDHLTWQTDHLTWQADHLTWQADHLTWQSDDFGWQADLAWLSHLTWQADHLTWQGDHLTWQDSMQWTDGKSIAFDWGLRAVGARNAWKRGNTGAGVKVAVLDTGIALDHPALRVEGGINVIDPEASYADDNGHGTHMAGIIAARGAQGLYGVAPDVSLYAVKVFGADGSGYVSDVVKGLEWAIENGVQVVNLSLGGSSSSRAIKETLEEAREEGIVVVAAAGNDGKPKGTGNSLQAPAKYESVIAVGAVGPNLSRATFSATGKGLDYMAPGVKIRSTFPGGSMLGSGTSQSAAFVSGLVSLILAENPDASPQQVERILRQTAQPLSNQLPSPAYGYGLARVPAQQ